MRACDRHRIGRQAIAIIEGKSSLHAQDTLGLGDDEETGSETTHAGARNFIADSLATSARMFFGCAGLRLPGTTGPTARSHCPSSGVKALTESTLADIGTVADPDAGGTPPTATAGWAPLSLQDVLRPYSKTSEERSRPRACPEL